MAGPGHNRVPALLDNQPVCATADNQDRLGCLRSGDRSGLGVSALAAGRSASFLG